MDMKTKRGDSDSMRLSDGVKCYVRYSFKRNCDLSAAHNFGHVSRVAINAYLIVKVLGGTEREAELARAGGYLHDFIRSRSEGVDDEAASAEKARPMLLQLVKSGVFTNCEANAILVSIKTESVPKELLVSEEKDNISYFLEDTIRLIRLAVFLGDKLDANGAFVIARRSQFVGGERLCHGDLKNLKERLETEKHPFAKELDSEMAVLLESYVRLGFKNNQSFYPKWFLPVVNDLFSKQREFYYALLSANGLQESDIANSLIEIRYPGINAGDIKKWETKRPDSTSEVNRVTIEEREAALEVVNFFSSSQNTHMDTAGLIRKFQPKTAIAYEWHMEMLSYLDKGVGPLLSVLSLKVPISNNCLYTAPLSDNLRG